MEKNRIIKFRAYIKNENKRVPSETNKIVEVKSLHLGSRKAIIGYSKSSSNYGNYSISFDDIELMQYTGLKDKNGKEIYEGDIIHINDNFLDKFDYLIEWNEEYLRYYLYSVDKEKLNKLGGILEAHLNSLEVEVIGNIYDNPELLEKEGD